MARTQRNRPIKTSPYDLDEDILKVVVVGEPRVGKTSFIRAYYNHHEPERPLISHYGAMGYSCSFTGSGGHWRTAIFEVPGGSDSILEQRTLLYKDADLIVYTYAVDDKLSLEMIKDKWIPETKDIILSQKIPAVLVGNKNDLRSNRQVIERLALNNQEPVTFEEGKNFLLQEEIDAFVEISSRNLGDVSKAFKAIFTFTVKNC